MAPIVRPRRLRSTAALRRLVSEVHLTPADLILPMFVKESLEEPAPLTGMPGVVQHTLTSLREAAREAVDAGVGGLMLFGIPTVRDERGSAADDPEGILNRALRMLRDEFGDDTVIMADLCLDEFTSHGHCGVLDEAGRVDNDATLERYASMAVAQARAGAHVLGLSGMMDGQVGVCREALDDHGFTDVVVMGYTAKYASAFYGPFREAVDSELVGDRKTYQQDPANGREAMHELDLDLAEGADIVMVKPGLPYLDVLAEVAAESPVPVWTYQVSGEYAMIEFAAAAGAIDRDRAIEESLIAFKRAGADAILTYWATEVSRWLSGGRR
ncbi:MULTISPECIES: porphobilinogen synthase [Brevibacterium]|uniref:Delta-aminolevulinic acid dehydratase n=1 Tax=Brevibacterium casei TaxID=33889 RepID=A0A7T4A215_9MICO|nr:MULTISPECIES: porphobilinogen synthase [Brevibacterium]MCM1013555.1 porphobilinogen synthase [Brevibacterium sp. XM4083]QQB15837.1 porphobilinogen synthase [Brevibacterium casei]